MKLIPLSRGFFAIVDDRDFKRLNQWKWSLLNQERNRYAIRVKRINNEFFRFRMHRVIMGAKEGQMIDHKNGDGLDNRRSNLRFCTKSQNTQNAKRYKSSNRKYKGVSKVNKRYRASLGYNNKRVHIGYFDTEIEAAKAYNKMALKYFKAFDLLIPV